MPKGEGGWPVPTNAAVKNTVQCSAVQVKMSNVTSHHIHKTHCTLMQKVSNRHTAFGWYAALVWSSGQRQTKAG